MHATFLFRTNALVFHDRKILVRAKDALYLAPNVDPSNMIDDDLSWEEIYSKESHSVLSTASRCSAQKGRMRSTPSVLSGETAIE